TDTQAAIDEVAAGSTDDQNLTLLGNTLSIENGNDVDLSGYLYNTDDQDASEVSYDNTTSGLTATDTQAAIDEVAAGSADVKNLTRLRNILCIENGNVAGLSGYLVYTDDQDSPEVSSDNTTSGSEPTDTQAAIDEVAAGSTDDQNLTLLG